MIFNPRFHHNHDDSRLDLDLSAPAAASHSGVTLTFVDDHSESLDLAQPATPSLKKLKVTEFFGGIGSGSMGSPSASVAGFFDSCETVSNIFKKHHFRNMDFRDHFAYEKRAHHLNHSKSKSRDFDFE